MHSCGVLLHLLEAMCLMLEGTGISIISELTLKNDNSQKLCCTTEEKTSSEMDSNAPQNCSLITEQLPKLQENKTHRKREKKGETKREEERRNRWWRRVVKPYECLPERWYLAALRPQWEKQLGPESRLLASAERAASTEPILQPSRDNWLTGCCEIPRIPPEFPGPDQMLTRREPDFKIL